MEEMEMPGMMSGMPTQPAPTQPDTPANIQDADPAQLEQMMAEQVKKNAPEEVQEFLDEVQSEGVTPQEIDEIRQLILAALKDPKQFPKLTTYLVNADLMEDSEIPDAYDAGFVLSMLGLVGVVQENVASSQLQ